MESTAGVNSADTTAGASGATAAEDSWAVSSEVVLLVVVSVLAVLAEEDRLVSWFPGYVPSKHVKLGHYRPASETPSKWRFAGGPILARDLMLTGYCGG